MLSESYTADGDREAGIILLLAVAEFFPNVNNTTDQPEEAGADFDAEDSAYYDSGEKELLAQLLAFVLANKSHFR